MSGNPKPQAASAPSQANALADFLWKRQEPGLDHLSSADTGGTTHDPDAWRDALLAEVEDLAETLRKKVARYASLRAAQPSALVEDPASETAVLWIQHALEDIAATALGINIASRELFLQAASAQNQEAKSELPGAEPRRSLDS
ncbi:hypothetical protein [Arthrobacter sp. Soil763]|uniref:hypothetical protein n=1 Tax=Arthrobacter sp. Soil763 TaxID=1736402 RepID=UPI000B03C54D|nr:hypothetical protein [Arthrobacter sp. Soil763]